MRQSGKLPRNNSQPPFFYCIKTPSFNDIVETFLNKPLSNERMKIPKQMKRFCPFCKKHTEHKVTLQKHRGLSKTHTQSRGSQTRTKKRGSRAGTGNLGRYSRRALAQWKMTGAKASKKTDLRYTCSVCQKTHVQKAGKRSKKVEMV